MISGKWQKKSLLILSDKKKWFTYFKWAKKKKFEVGRYSRLSVDLQLSCFLPHRAVHERKIVM